MTPPALRHVFVGIPVIGPWVTGGIAQFAESLGHQNGLGRDVHFTLKILSAPTLISFPVEFMRNRLVAMALRNPSVTDLWFIDSDTIPSVNAMTLLDLKSDLAAGVYKIPDGREGEVWSAYEAVGDKYRKMPMLPAAPFEAGGAGTGAMIISRRVLADPHLRFGPDEDGIPCLFRTVRTPTGECIYTDDLDFCLRARKAGYTLTVDPRVLFGHVKTRIYE